MKRVLKWFGVWGLGFGVNGGSVAKEWLFCHPEEQPVPQHAGRDLEQKNKEQGMKNNEVSRARKKMFNIQLLLSGKKIDQRFDLRPQWVCGE